MSILVITTGGTIGALPYDDLKKPPKIKTMPPQGQDLVRDVLMRDFADIATRCVSVEQRDSNFIDEDYRREILRIIEKAPETGILITHGTDTVLATAEFFDRELRCNPALSDKVILITGSMVPLACGPESDGYLNLKFSLEQFGKFSPGRGVGIVLCDYRDPKTQDGWGPCFYQYKPGQYQKIYDPEDSRRDRVSHIGNQAGKYDKN